MEKKRTAEAIQIPLPYHKELLSCDYLFKMSQFLFVYLPTQSHPKLYILKICMACSVTNRELRTPNLLDLCPAKYVSLFLMSQKQIL